MTRERVVGMRRRVSAVEEYIEKRVEERMEMETETVLARLEKELDRQTFIRVLEIVAGEERRGA